MFKLLRFAGIVACGRASEYLGGTLKNACRRLVKILISLTCRPMAAHDRARDHRPSVVTANCGGDVADCLHAGSAGSQLGLFRRREGSIGRA
jgi:hypothetical protein